MARGLVLQENQVERIEQVLDQVQSKTGATFVLLADISGQLIASRGRGEGSKLVPLAALTASNISATNEIARMIGEASNFKSLFHEGEQENIYLSHVGTSFLLAIVFNTRVQIGLVRLFSKRAVEELATLIAEYEAKMSTTQNVMEATLLSDWEAELDRLLPN